MLLSPDGFSPRLWGPQLWRVMHLVSVNYPLNPTRVQQRAYYNFFNSLKCILPCKTCREEFNKMVSRPPYTLTPALFAQRPGDPPGTARRRLAQYVVTLHNVVNARLGKPPGRQTRNWVQYYANLRRQKINVWRR